MTSRDQHSTVHAAPSIALDLLRGIFLLLWQVIRLPVFCFLVILEPFVSLVLAGAAVLGVLTTCVFALSGVAPHFPTWVMLGFSIACGMLLAAYQAALQLLSR